MSRWRAGIHTGRSVFSSVVFVQRHFISGNIYAGRPSGRYFQPLVAVQVVSGSEAFSVFIRSLYVTGFSGQLSQRR